MNQFPAVIELADLDGSNGFRIDGEKVGAGLGRTVASAGDVNGDGLTDLIMGGYGNKTDYVVFGTAAGFGPTFDLATLDGHNGFEIDDFHIGQTVSSAGDVNGDGFDDVVVGSWREGAAYLVYGKADGFSPNIDLADLNGVDGTTFSGSGVFSGWQVSGLGDINGDGFDDMLFGCRGDYDGGGNYSGGAIVIYGTDQGFGAHVSLSSLTDQGFRFQDAGRYDDNGRGIATGAGDINGDGLNDIFVSAGSGYDGAKSHVVFGQPGKIAGFFDLASLDGSNGFTLDAGGGIGTLAQAGDVNGDGFDDIIALWRGGSSVVFGAAHFDADVVVESLDGADGFNITLTGSFVSSVAAAGDVNGDGFADLIIGSSYADHSATDSGSSYVVFGKASGWGASIDLATLDGANGFRIDGAAAGDGAGVSAASAGDLNGDGLDDIMVGATGTDNGSVYVVYGVLPDAKVNRAGTDASQHLVGGDFNDKLAGHGGGDELWGNGGKDKLFGQDGDDTLHGGEGKDQLTGGDGDDVLIGGAGRDRMTGGEGSNRFVFGALADSPAKGGDIIVDLHNGDLIDLSAIDADATQDGDQAFALVKHFSHHAGEVVLSFDGSANTTLLQADVDGDGEADFSIEMIGKHDAFHGLVV